MKIGLTYNIRMAEDPDGPRLGAQAADACDFAAANGASALDDQEEFDSPETISALTEVLEALGHDVDLLGDGEDLLRRLLDCDRPELVLNIAEGCGSSRTREARVPAVLEMLGIPYTGSDPLALSVTLDKDCAKRLVAAAGVATPRWVLVESEPDADVEAQLSALGCPLIVKPAYEGSSKGILSASVVDDRDRLAEVVNRVLATYRQPALVEEFIEGDELTVGLIGNSPPQVLGVMRVVPRVAQKRFVYSLEVKRDWRRQVRYECPARISPDEMQAVQEAALCAWKALGCRDVARMDFRLASGKPYFLEVNPLPGLSPVSGDLVLLAGFMGIEYPELISRIVAAAAARVETHCGCFVRSH